MAAKPKRKAKKKAHCAVQSAPSFALDAPTDTMSKDEVLDLQEQVRGIVRYHRTWDTSITCTVTEVQTLCNTALRALERLDAVQTAAFDLLVAQNGFTARDLQLIKTLNPTVIGQDLVDAIHRVAGLK